MALSLRVASWAEVRRYGVRGVFERGLVLPPIAGAAETPSTPSGGVALTNPGTLATVLTTRTVSDGVTNSTTTVTSATASFVAGDVGRVLTGSADLPNADWINSVTNGTTALLGVAATAGHSAQTLNLTAEYVLWASAVAGLFSLHVDLSAMAAGDIIELRCYQMILTGGARRVLDLARFSDAQPTDGLISVFDPMGSDLADVGAIMYTLKQTAGSARSVPVKVLQY